MTAEKKPDFKERISIGLTLISIILSIAIAFLIHYVVIQSRFSAIEKTVKIHDQNFVILQRLITNSQNANKPIPEVKAVD